MDISHRLSSILTNFFFLDQKQKILVPKIDSLMGKMVEVEIVECTKFSMKGKLLDENYLHQQPNVNTPLKKGEISGNSIKSKVKK